MEAVLVGERKGEIAAALRQDHEYIRSELSLAMSESGAIGQSATALARLCVPHFELEEKLIFPILARLHILATSKNGRPQFIELQSQFIKLSDLNKQLGRGHHAISRAAKALLRVATEEGNPEFAALADMMLNHEWVEEQLGLAAMELGRPQRDQRGVASEMICRNR